MVKLSNLQTIFSMLLLVLMMSSCDSCKEENEVNPDDGNNTGECTKNYTSKTLSMNCWYGKQPSAKPINNKYIDFATGETFETETSACDAFLSADDNGISLVGLNGTKFKALFAGRNFSKVCDQHLSGTPSDNSIDASSCGDNAPIFVFKDQNGKYGAIWIEHVYDLRINDWWKLNKIRLIYSNR